MASQSETGHAKNIASFEILITYCKGYGSNYNPANTTLSVDQLTSLNGSTATALSVCAKKLTLFNYATDERMKAFSNLKPLATQIINALMASGVGSVTIDTAKTINRKLQGQRAGKAKLPVDANGTPGGSVSASQLSYDNQIAHFNELIELLDSITDYQPNESALQVANLQVHLATLKGVNSAVIQSQTDWSNSRVVRDHLMYDVNTGMVDIALQVKAYVKSIYGASSKEFKQVSGVKFTRPR